MSDIKKAIDKVKELPEGERDALLEKMSKEVQEEERSELESANTVVTKLADDPSAAEKVENVTPAEMFEKQISLNVKALYEIEKILNSGIFGSKVSRNNLVKLFISALAIPEGGKSISFGGTAKQQEACKYVFHLAQMAVSSKTYVTATQAIRHSKAQKEQKEQKEK